MSLLFQVSNDVQLDIIVSQKIQTEKPGLGAAQTVFFVLKNTRVTWFFDFRFQAFSKIRVKTRMCSSCSTKNKQINNFEAMKGNLHSLKKIGELWPTSG